MGMFDYVKYKMKCPKCGETISDFQSKSGECMLSEVEYWEVPNFYSSCNKCGTWVEFNRKVTPERIPISDYKKTVRKKEK